MQTAPLTSSQLRLWLHEQLYPHVPAYNVCVLFDFVGQLDVPALESALFALTARHEILRTRYVELPGGVPHQIVDLPTETPIRLISLDELGEAAAMVVARARAQEFARLPFDLEHGAVLRLELTRIATDRHLLVLVVHHIAVDSWALRLIFRELKNDYEACTASRATWDSGRTVAQYRDYALYSAQRTHDASQDYAEQLEYWTRQLDGAPALRFLTRVREPSTVALIRELELDPQFVKRIDSFAARMATTRFVVMLAAWQLALTTISGDSDVSVGIPFSTRDRVVWEEVIGVFVNLLIIRSQVDSLAPFENLVQSVHRTCMEAYRNADVPFERVVEALRVHEKRDWMSPVQAAFAFENPIEKATFGPTRVRIETLSLSAPRFPIEMTLVEAEGGLRGRITYDERMIATREIDCVGRAFLDALVSEEGAECGDAPPIQLDDAKVQTDVAGREAAGRSRRR